MPPNPIAETYESHDALALAALVARGEVSAHELLDAAIERCERHAALGAVVMRHFDAARAAIDAGLPEGPLRGVPFLLKDLGLQLQGTRTTGGCRYFAEHVADHDSELVTRYKRAGLVIFGKTASPEFGLTTTTESQLHGVTRNPWNREHTSGGSSGGASAAVAAGILPLANASDGGGSIRIPASCCGLFGLKPTRGRVPFGPRVGEGWSGMSTIHALSRSVRDNAALLDATHGADPGAPYFAPPVTRPFLEEVAAPPGRLRIALQTQAFNGSETHEDCIAAARDAAALCRELGHEVEEAVIDLGPDWVGELGGATGTIIPANVQAEIDAREEVLGRPPGEEDLELFTRILLAGSISRSAADYARAVRVLHRTGRGVARFFERFDLILTPTIATPPLEIGALSLSNPDIATLARNVMATSGYTQLFNVTGQPAISVPLFWNEAGLPIGVQFAARFGNEAGLLRIAAQLEQARPWFDRRPPLC